MLSEDEFLDKYGNELVNFYYLSKYRIEYINQEYGFVVGGLIDRRDTFKPIQTVRDIWQLEFFEFRFLK